MTNSNCDDCGREQFEVPGGGYYCPSCDSERFTGVTLRRDITKKVVSVSTDSVVDDVEDEEVGEDV